MKPLVIMVLFALAVPHSFAEIKNGYIPDLLNANRTLNNLGTLINGGGMSEDDLIDLETNHAIARKRQVFIKRQYRKTQKVLACLKAVHPQLYAEIDGIRDRTGHDTDVYVRVMSAEQMNEGQMGTTNLKQATDDPDIYQSRFGRHTVSVCVRDCSLHMTLKLLVHELGHVKYQVPNLAEYVRYFKEAYQCPKLNNRYGHANDDPSGQCVCVEVKKYLALYRDRKHLLRNKHLEDDMLFAEELTVSVK